MSSTMTRREFSLLEELACLRRREADIIAELNHLMGEDLEAKAKQPSAIRQNGVDGEAAS